MVIWQLAGLAGLVSMAEIGTIRPRRRDWSFIADLVRAI
jgi:hypothetical protein